MHRKTPRVGRGRETNTVGDVPEERKPFLMVDRIDCSHPMLALLHIKLADGKGIIIDWFGGKHEEYGADSY